MNYHIRKRLRPRGGNNFYRDNSIRPTSTFCGAPVTEFDCGWRDKITTWPNRDGVQMTVCPKCLEEKTDSLLRNSVGRTLLSRRSA